MPEGSSERPRQVPCPKPLEQLKLLVHHHLSHLYLDRLKERFPSLPVVVLDNNRDLERTLAAEQPDMVLSFKIPNDGPFPRELLLNWPSIRWLHATGAGIEHLPPWDPRRIMVTNSSGIHTGVMAEYAVWAVLNQTLQMPLYAKQQQEHRWNLHTVDPVHGKTAAIIGIGKVGREIAARLKPFGVRIFGVRNRADPVPEADEVFTIDQIGQALERADFVILITPLTPATRGLFDAGMLSKFKRGSYFINLARGGIVDEQALRQAIASGHLAGATLDVFAKEPLPPDDPMWDAENVIVTPHASGEVADWHALAAMVFAENLDRWTKGAPLKNLCDPALGY